MTMHLRGCRHHLWDSFRALEASNTAQERLFLNMQIWLCVCCLSPGKVSVCLPTQIWIGSELCFSRLAVFNCWGTHRRHSMANGYHNSCSCLQESSAPMQHRPDTSWCHPCLKAKASQCISMETSHSSNMAAQSPQQWTNSVLSNQRRERSD